MVGSNGSSVASYHEHAPGSYPTDLNGLFYTCPTIWVLLIALYTVQPRKFLPDLRLYLFFFALLDRQRIWTLVRRAALSIPSHYLLFPAVCGIAYTIANGSRRSATSDPHPKFLRPLIYLCNTTHERLFPKKHGFSYSYLVVGIPIGWRKTAGILSCDPRSVNETKGWFSVHNEDYLARGTHRDGLRGKLDDYLRSQNAHPSDYPLAYLVTAPRFLGWSFNPVSFWYLYDIEEDLKAMILEVNNTFDERRMYFLQSSRRGARFSNAWQKDFHVSPFNDREGNYSLTAEDPFARRKTKQPPNIFNKIILSSPPPDSKPKLTARLNTNGRPLDPAQMNTSSTFRFIMRWCWVGFLTNPRILREAYTLWAKMGMPVFYRPEINVGSIGRQEQEEEAILEKGFKSWLTHIAASQHLKVGYTSAAGLERGKRVVLGENATQKSSTTNRIGIDFDVEVLTPEWYSELATVRDVREAFRRRCFEATEGECMLSTDATGMVHLKLALEELSSPLPAHHCRQRNNTVAAMNQRLRNGERLLYVLVRAVCDLVLPSTSVAASFNRLQLTNASRADQQAHDNATLMILLSQRLSLGYTFLLRVYGNLLRWTLLFVLAWSTPGAVDVAAKWMAHMMASK